MTTMTALHRKAPGKIVFSALLAWAMLVLSAGGVMAQTTTTSSTDGSTPLALSPGSPAGSYALSGFESINPYNGNLNFRLPLLQIAGRGAAQMAMVLAIDAKSWRVKHAQTVDPNTGQEIDSYIPEPNPWTGLKPGYGPGVLQGRQAGIFPTQSCAQTGATKIYQKTLTRLTFTGPDGTEFELRDQATGGQPATITDPCANGFSRGSVFITADGSAATFVSDTVIRDKPQSASGSSVIFPSGTLKLRDGTQFRVDAGLVSWIRDRNGNKLSFVYDAFNRIATITDSLNRQVTISYQVSDVAPYGLSDQITYKGFGGATRTIRVSYANLSSALRPNSGFAISTFKQLFPELNGSSTGTYNPVVVSAVWLPDGSRRYGLFYDSYGELARVELPTGGAIEYDAAPGSGAVTDGFDFHILRRVAVRRLYPDGVTLEGTTTYSPSSVTDTTVVEDHRDAGGSLLARVKHSYFGNPEQSLFQEAVDYPAWKHGREFQTEALSVDGVTVLSRQTPTWQQRAAVSWWNPSFPDLAPPNDPRISESATTLADTNQISKQSFQYDQFNNKTDVSEFDYGAGAAGPLSRRTHTDYLTLNPINGADYTDPAIHLRGLPAQQSVFDAGGIERARTTFEYDNYTAGLAGRINISGHDAAFGTGYLTRGNATQITNWLLPGTTISTRGQYDIAGNAISRTDPRGFATTIDFSDRFGTPNGEARSNSAPAELGGQVSYAFPTQVTNALGQSVFAQFDYSLGRPVDAEDANGTVASGSYNDILDRPTQVVRGANTSLASQTTFSYNDASRIVTTTSDLNSFNDHLIKSEAFLDGLGRTMETRGYEPGGSFITSRQTYDGLGRVNQSFNPTRNFAEDTYGWTTTSYDALSRVTRVETLDRFGVSAGVVTTTYAGNQVTVTDQAGKARRSVADELGRLTQVIEDPFGLAYSTSYSYDSLGNLTGVSQGQQSRSFSYDSLSRLTSATNPESGTISYVYDSNGNLTTKTDARGVATSFSYDGLNRVTFKSYSDATTPSVTYAYDTVGVANSKGRLTSVSSSASTYSYSGYDALGRVQGSTQTISGQSYPMSYAYNLAGGLTSMTYPSGRVVSQSYDSAGRIASVSGVKGATSTTYASVFGYAPHGAIQSLTLGNGLIESAQFNNRLQPTNISLGSLLSLTYNYGLTNNNGNVLSMTITPGTGQTPILQTFTYDVLNRLQSGTETVSGSQTWKQTNGFDQYGNRWIDSLNTTGNVMGPIASQSDINASNNRIVKAGYAHDAAGNMTAEPGKSYTFDGENKIVTALVGSSTSNYVYDGEGRRVKKVTPSGTTVMVYDAAGQMIAEYSDAPAAGPGGTQYATADHLGTPRLWTNQQGAIISRHDYLPFGEELFSGLGGRTTAQGYSPSAQTDGQRNQFTSKERDTETNLDYFLARYYSSAFGRFTSVDLLNPMIEYRGQASSDENEKKFQGYLLQPQHWNRYAYVFNNPVILTDPDGREGGLHYANASVQPPNVDPKAAALVGALGFAGIPVLAPSATIAGVRLALTHPATTIQLAALALEASGGPPGLLSGAVGKLSQAERSTAEFLVSEGKNVVVQEATGVGRTADFIVNGVKTELKNLEGVAGVATDGTVKSAIGRALGQSGNVLLDARNVSLTEAAARQGAARAFGADKRLQVVRIIGKDFDVTIQRNQ